MKLPLITSAVGTFLFGLNSLPIVAEPEASFHISPSDCESCHDPAANFSNFADFEEVGGLLDPTEVEPDTLYQITLWVPEEVPGDDDGENDPHAFKVAFNNGQVGQITDEEGVPLENQSTDVRAVSGGKISETEEMGQPDVSKTYYWLSPSEEDLTSVQNIEVTFTMMLGVGGNQNAGQHLGTQSLVLTNLFFEPSEGGGFDDDDEDTSSGAGSGNGGGSSDFEGDFVGGCGMLNSAKNSYSFLWLFSLMFLVLAYRRKLTCAERTSEASSTR